MIPSVRGKGRQLAQNGWLGNRRASLSHRVRMMTKSREMRVKKKRTNESVASWIEAEREYYQGQRVLIFMNGGHGTVGFVYQWLLSCHRRSGVPGFSLIRCLRGSLHRLIPTHCLNAIFTES